jgi:hypothetical protein
MTLNYTISRSSLINTMRGTIWLSEELRMYATILKDFISKMSNLRGCLKMPKRHNYTWYDILFVLPDLDLTEEVFRISKRVITLLMAHDVLVPQIFSHGPKSIVLQWTVTKYKNATSGYLTITEKHLSYLIAGRHGIKHRSYQDLPNRFK